MSTSEGIPGTAVVAVFGGFVLLYSGLKNHAVSDSVRSFLRGEVPTDTGTPIGGGGSGAAPTPSGDASGSNFQNILAYLYKLGFTDAGAAGALGNIQQESGFSPTAYNSGEGAIGICQWEGGRRTVGLQGYARVRGLSESDLDAQLGYMGVELTSGFAHVRIQGMAAVSPANFAAVWDGQYEISDGSTRQIRINNAIAIYNNIKGAKGRAK